MEVLEQAEIALSKLVLSPLNVRKIEPTHVEELAALIAAQGVLQALIVHPVRKKKRVTGQYAVVAGGRRLRALQLLRERGMIGDDYPIACRVIDEARAVEVSLAENSGREAMHPADEFDAFKKLIEDGKSVEDVAAAFGVSPLLVQRRLRLASASPRLLDLYREDEMNLDQLMALCMTEDHARQEQVWLNAAEWQRHASHLRQQLREEVIEATRDKRMRLVGVDAYLAAGGTLRRDLFSDEQNAGFVDDEVLLEQLALAKLNAEAQIVKAEGWAWVDVALHMDYSELSEFRHVPCSRIEPSEEQQARLDAIEEELEQISVAFDSGEADEDALRERNDALEQEQEALEESLHRIDPIYADKAGAIVTIASNGVVDIRRGLIRPGDFIEPKRNGVGVAEETKALHSERLVKTLTGQRTVALQAALLGRPDVALAALTQTLVVGVFYHTYTPRGPVKIRADIFRGSEGDGIETSRAFGELDAARQQWQARLPEDSGDLFNWLLDQPRDDMLGLLTFCIALSLDTRQARETTVDPQVTALEAALAFEFADWWTASRETYLAAVPKARIVEVVAEACGSEAAMPIMKQKKEEAIAFAEQKLVGKRWIPAFLRA